MPRPANDPDAVIAVCVRASVAAIVVMRGTTVYEVQRRFIRHTPRGERRVAYVAAAVRTMAEEYGIDTIVTEADHPVMSELNGHVLKVSTTTIAEARRYLGCTTIAEVHKHILENYPALRRFFVRKTINSISLLRREQTVILLSVALGLTAEARRRKDRPMER